MSSYFGFDRVESQAGVGDFFCAPAQASQEDLDVEIT